MAESKTKPRARKAAAAAKGPLLAVVGCNVGGDRFDPGDTIPAGRMKPTTAAAWLAEGLVTAAEEETD